MATGGLCGGVPCGPPAAGDIAVGGHGCVVGGCMEECLFRGYLLAERNLWPLIAMHATWNTVAIWGVYRS
jgi:membrane protease YdiL (CAAX protease family)